MSRFTGRAGRGAHRAVRAQKRYEAEARNAATLPDRRKRARLAAESFIAALIVRDADMRGDE